MAEKDNNKEYMKKLYNNTSPDLSNNIKSNNKKIIDSVNTTESFDDLLNRFKSTREKLATSVGHVTEDHLMQDFVIAGQEALKDYDDLITFIKEVKSQDLAEAVTPRDYAKYFSGSSNNISDTINKMQFTAVDQKANLFAASEILTNMSKSNQPLSAFSFEEFKDNRLYKLKDTFLSSYSKKYGKEFAGTDAELFLNILEKEAGVDFADKNYSGIFREDIFKYAKTVNEQPVYRFESGLSTTVWNNINRTAYDENEAKRITGIIYDLRSELIDEMSLIQEAKNLEQRGVAHLNKSGRSGYSKERWDEYLDPKIFTPDDQNKILDSLNDIDKYNKKMEELGDLYGFGKGNLIYRKSIGLTALNDVEDLYGKINNLQSQLKEASVVDKALIEDNIKMLQDKINIIEKDVQKTTKSTIKLNSIKQIKQKIKAEKDAKTGEIISRNIEGKITNKKKDYTNEFNRAKALDQMLKVKGVGEVEVLQVTEDGTPQALVRKKSFNPLNVKFRTKDVVAAAIDADKDPNQYLKYKDLKTIQDNIINKYSKSEGILLKVEDQIKGLITEDSIDDLMGGYQRIPKDTSRSAVNKLRKTVLDIMHKHEAWALYTEDSDRAISAANAAYTEALSNMKEIDMKILMVPEDDERAIKFTDEVIKNYNLDKEIAEHNEILANSKKDLRLGYKIKEDAIESFSEEFNRLFMSKFFDAAETGKGFKGNYLIDQLTNEYDAYPEYKYMSKEVFVKEAMDSIVKETADSKNTYGIKSMSLNQIKDYLAQRDQANIAQSSVDIDRIAELEGMAKDEIDHRLSIADQMNEDLKVAQEVKETRLVRDMRFTRAGFKRKVNYKHLKQLMIDPESVSDDVSFKDENTIRNLLRGQKELPVEIEGENYLARLNKTSQEIEIFREGEKVSIGNIGKNKANWIPAADIQTDYIKRKIKPPMVEQKFLELYNDLPTENISKGYNQYLSHSPTSTLQAIRDLFEEKTFVGFDYETTGLPGMINEDLLIPTEIYAEERRLIGDYGNFSKAEEVSSFHHYVRPTEKVKSHISKLEESITDLIKRRGNIIVEEAEIQDENLLKGVLQKKEKLIGDIDKLVQSEADIGLLKNYAKYSPGLVESDNMLYKKYVERSVIGFEDLPDLIEHSKRGRAFIESSDKTLDIAEAMVKINSYTKNKILVGQNVADADELFKIFGIRNANDNLISSLEIARNEKNILSQELADNINRISEEGQSRRRKTLSRKDKLQISLYNRGIINANEAAEEMSISKPIFYKRVKEVAKEKELIKGVKSKYIPRIDNLENRISLMEGYGKDLKNIGGDKNRLIELMHTYKMLNIDEAKRNLSSQAARYGIDLTGAHQADKDVQATIKIFFKQLTEMQENDLMVDILSDKDKYRLKEGDLLAKVSGEVEGKNFMQGAYIFEESSTTKDGIVAKFKRYGSDDYVSLHGDNITDLQYKISKDFARITPEELESRKEFYIWDRVRRNITKGRGGYDSFVRQKQNALYSSGEESRQKVINELNLARDQHLRLQHKQELINIAKENMEKNIKISNIDKEISLGNNLDYLQSEKDRIMSSRISAKERAHNMVLEMKTLTRQSGKEYGESLLNFYSKTKDIIRSNPNIKLEELIDKALIDAEKILITTAGSENPVEKIDYNIKRLAEDHTDDFLTEDKKTMYKETAKFYNSAQADIMEDKFGRVKALESIDTYGLTNSESKELIRQMNRAIKEKGKSLPKKADWVKRIGTTKVDDETIELFADVSSVNRAEQSISSILNRPDMKVDQLRSIIGKELQAENIPKTRSGLAEFLYVNKDKLKMAKLEDPTRIIDLKTSQELSGELDTIIKNFLKEKYRNIEYGDDIAEQLFLKGQEIQKATKGSGLNYLSPKVAFDYMPLENVYMDPKTGPTTVGDILGEIKEYRPYDTDEIKGRIHNRFKQWAKDERLSYEQSSAFRQRYNEELQRSVWDQIMNEDVEIKERNKNAYRKIVNIGKTYGGEANALQREALNALNWGTKEETVNMSLDQMRQQKITEGKFAGYTFGQVPEKELRRFAGYGLEPKTMEEYQKLAAKYDMTVPELKQEFRMVEKTIGKGAYDEMAFRAKNYFVELDRVGSVHISPEIGSINPYRPTPGFVDDSITNVLNNITSTFRDVEARPIRPAINEAIERTITEASTANPILNTVTEVSTSSIPKIPRLSNKALIGSGIAIAAAGMLAGGMRHSPVIPSMGEDERMDHGSNTNNAAVNSKAGSKIYTDFGMQVEIQGRKSGKIDNEDLSQGISSSVNGSTKTNINITTRDDRQEISDSWFEEKILKLFK
jgi:hypothetical protein